MVPEFGVQNSISIGIVIIRNPLIVCCADNILMTLIATKPISNSTSLRILIEHGVDAARKDVIPVNESHVSCPIYVSITVCFHCLLDFISFLISSSIIDLLVHFRFAVSHQDMTGHFIVP